jgi:hypothetical protein
MKTALQKLADDPRFPGARLGVSRCIAYLDMRHAQSSACPHAGDCRRSVVRFQRWVLPKNPKFLVPVRALSIIFAAKLRAALKKARLLDQAPSDVWNRPWVVHCQHAGSGEKVLDYLGRYVFASPSPIAYPTHSRRPCHLPLRRQPHAAIQARHRFRNRIPSPFPPARLAARLHQSPLLRHLQPSLSVLAQSSPISHFHSLLPTHLCHFTPQIRKSCPNVLAALSEHSSWSPLFNPNAAAPVIALSTPPPQSLFPLTLHSQTP